MRGETRGTRLAARLVVPCIEETWNPESLARDKIAARYGVRYSVVSSASRLGGLIDPIQACDPSGDVYRQIAEQARVAG